ncbi:DEAD/DEAH box helicase family protein [Flavobacteriaceae bacterium]|nr:DEAD/DEAH box helicase family protein [Flavobacteriaceae bacterium]MDB4058316.1 DEAD/DEAH box helicase family protein [Flavobacteriaceae bacterium]MDB4171818.1 DEAD/DEAH box helicase family protein [Flavobacteriaceae bacterium]
MEHSEIKSRFQNMIVVEPGPLLEAVDYNEKVLTKIKRKYSDKLPKGPNFGVIEYLSINEAVTLLNNLEGALKKDQAPALLKGLYKGGTGGVFLYKGAAYLPWDVDIKNTAEKKENLPLLDGKNNSDVFDYLKSISVFAARSNSGIGMFGYVRVDGIENLLVGEKKLHHEIGKAVTTKMSEMCLEATGTLVDFDPAQSVFRVIRNFPPQEKEIVINDKHLNFKVTVTKKEIVTSLGVPALTFTGDYSGHPGTIRYKFNEQNKIEDILPKYGFTHVNGNRWIHFSSTSDSTGQVNDNNTFWSYSSTFGEGLYSPFDLVKKAEGLSYRELIYRCKQEGYEDTPIEPSEIDLAVEKLHFGYSAPPSVFSVCDPLKRLPEKDKYEMLDRLNIRKEVLLLVCTYLEVVPLNIPYDHRLEIENYLSDSFSEIAEIISREQMVLISAGTGIGKTTAVVDFLLKQPDKRGIFLAPLQVIVDQVSKENNLPALIGNSSPSLHSEAKNAPLIVATFEQGIKYLADDKQHFDYIVIDEYHNLTLSQSFKQDVLRALYQMIKKTTAKVIGLSGTVSNALAMLDFTIINVVKKDQKMTLVKRRTANRSGHNTAINHIREFKGKRCIIRLNNTNDLDSIKAQLVEEGLFKSDEILILKSSKQIKESKDFRDLVGKGRVDRKFKIVLTTSLIDEGLSIRDAHFNHVVFIECNSFTPRPEPIAQNYARVRNPGTDVEYFLYTKFASKGDRRYYDEVDGFNSSLAMLEENKPESRSLHKNHLLSNSDYYLEDGSINKPRLAYDISQTAFGKFTPFMLDRYLRNYNLNVVFDDSFIEIQSDSAFKKAYDKSRLQALYHVWTNEWPTISFVINSSSQDPDLRCEEDYEPTGYNEECVGFVYENISIFEKYFKIQIKLRLIGVNPEQYIVKDNRLATIKQLNNDVFALETKAVIENPRSKEDHKAKEKLEAAISCLIDMETCTKEEVLRAFDDGVVLNKPSVDVAVKVLKEYTDVTYNKRAKRYRVKKKMKDPDEIDLIF